MKRSNKTLMAFGSVFLVVLLVLSCDNPSDSTQGDAIIWPEGSSPQIESANGEFTLKRGSPGGRVVKIDYYYALRTVLAPSRGSDTETDWSDWTRLLDAGTYKALVGEYHLFAIAGDSAGNTVRSEEVIFEVHSLPKWVALPVVEPSAVIGELALGEAGEVQGLPTPVITHYYAASEIALPEVLSDDEESWSAAGFSAISSGTPAEGLSGDYNLYGLASNKYGSTASEPVAITVIGPPLWAADPTVDVSVAGQFTMNEGSARGAPSPTVAYYYAPAGTNPPTDSTEETAWTDGGFTVVLIDSATVTSPLGDYVLYGEAVNEQGRLRSSAVSFTVAASTLSTPDAPSVTSSIAGEFFVEQVDAQGEPKPTVAYYYAARDTATPADAAGDWSAFTEISDQVAAGKSVVVTGGGDFDAYAVASNSAGSKASVASQFTVTVPTMPVWTVLPVANTSTLETLVITAGTVSGDPAPSVRYFFCNKGHTPLEANADWSADPQFQEVFPEQEKKITSGEYDLYGIASNNVGDVLSTKVEFAIVGVLSWASSPTVNVAYTSLADKKAEFSVDVDSIALNNSAGGITLAYYYASASVSPPSVASGAWSGFIDITAAVNDGQAVVVDTPGEWNLYVTAVAEVNTSNMAISPPVSINLPEPSIPEFASDHTVSINVIADTASFRLEAATVKGHPAPSVAYYMGEHVASPGWDAAWTQEEWEANGYSVVSPGEDQDSMHGAFDFVAVATNQWATELKSVTADISAGDKVSLIENPVVDTATAGSLRITQAARVNVENPEIRYFYASGDSWNSPLDSVDPDKWLAAGFREMEFDAEVLGLEAGRYDLYVAVKAQANIMISERIIIEVQ